MSLPEDTAVSCSLLAQSTPLLAAKKLNILLVDDRQAKLLSYEVILAGIGETLIKASSACEALECLLKHEVTTNGHPLRL